MHSAHPLAVKVLHHLGHYHPLVPHEHQLCRICYIEVEDEAHILLECQANTELTYLRSVFLNDIMVQWPPQTRGNLLPFELLCSLVGDDRIVQKMGKFVFDMLAIVITIPVWVYCEAV